MHRLSLLAFPLLALLAWAFSDSGIAPESEARDTESPVRPTAESRPVLLGSPEADAPRDPRDEIPLGDSPLESFGVACRVRTHPSYGAAPGVVVRLRLEGGGVARFPPREATTDEAGEARFGPVPIPAVPRHVASSAHLVVELVEPREVGGGSGILPEDLQPTPSPRPAGSVDPASTATCRWFRRELLRASGVPVSGRVTTESGAPLEGALVSVGERDGSPVRTDASGAFRDFAEGPGATVVRASWPTWDSHGAMREETVLVPGPAGVSGLTLVLRGLGEIRGTALDADGRPATGAELHLVRPDETMDDVVMYSMGYGPPNHLHRQADADGTFRFVGTVTGERYDVRWWSGFEDEVGAAGVASGTRDLRVRLDRHGVLPQPVDARDGSLLRADLTVGRGTEVLDPQARWWCPWVPERTCLGEPGARLVIYARARGYDDAVLEHVVSTKPGLDVVRIPMRPKGSRATVRVRCVDRDGVALPWPAARWSHEPTGAKVALEARVDDGGALVTADLVAGTYRAACDEGVPASGTLRFVLASETLVEVPPDGRLHVDWTLPVGGALRVTTRRADGSVVGAGERGSLRIRDRRGVDTPLRPFREEGPGRWKEGARDAGPYETQALVPERHLLLWYDRAEEGTPRASRWVDVRASEVTAADLVEGTFERY